MAFPDHAHGRPQVIQGNFQGCLPTFAVQARTASPLVARRPMAPHVAAALGKPAPLANTAQRHTGPQPLAAQPHRIGNAFRVPPTVNLSSPGQGRPLPEAVRRKMESFFKTGFSDVRVHVGAQAKTIGAVAFTMGSQIHFAPGQYNPHTAYGQRLLGHELAHVVQQRAGRVRNPFGSGVAVVQDQGLEAEADRRGIQAAMHQVPVHTRPAGAQTRAYSLKASTNSIVQPYAPEPDVEVEDVEISRKDWEGQAGKTLLQKLANQCGETETIEQVNFEVIDLSERTKNTSLTPHFQQLYAALASVAVNYKNGPLHRNEEQKLPTTDNDWRYIECYYVAGGMRLIVDTKTGRSFVSAHYGKFYILSDSGQNPISGKVAKEIYILSEAYQSNDWKKYTALYGYKAFQ